MKKTKRFLLCSMAIILTTAALGAESAEQSRAGQITFFYPMGSAGVDSMKYSNAFSLNLVYGMNGGVDAFELGGVGNFNLHDVRGIQIAGVSNINMDETKGMQFAGVSNTNMGDSTGLIWSGTLNSVFGDSRGIMISNINVTTGEMRGLQIGTLNYAAKSKGVQLGVVNVAAEGSESLPIGILSIVKGGYFALETSAGDTLYANMSYKMGVERFYTIFRISGSVMDYEALYNGGNYEDQDYLLSYGMGWGGMVSMGGNNRLALEGVCHSIVHDFDWESESVNLLAKLDMNYHLGMGEHFSLFFGPSFNVYVTEESLPEQVGTLPVPYTFFDETYETVRVAMWAGANAGLTVRF